MSSPEVINRDDQRTRRILLGLVLGFSWVVLPGVLGAQRPLPGPVKKTVPQAQAPGARGGIIALPVTGCPAGVTAWWADQQRPGGSGRIVCAADPTRPAILLFHGLHQDAQTWTAPSHTGYAYDYTHTPDDRRIGDTHNSGNAGIYKVGTSDWLYGNDRAAWDKAHNWFDYLVKQGFTVATWSQPGLRVEEAMPSALAAFDSLLAQTSARSPTAPPPVALIAHSRGGLLIRQVLKQRGSMGRVRWVITLHSPHKGSELGETPGRLTAEVVDLIDCCAPAVLTAPFKAQLKDLVVEAMRPVTKLFMSDENRELTPDSPLIRGLAEGEKKLDDVTYYTFGGVNPRIYRLYTWLFDAMSATPQFNPTPYFVWRVKAAEIASISPILDRIRHFVPEVTPGKGDGLVSDESSRLPWSIHTTTQLNHAEVLWNAGLMRKVAGLLDPALAARTVEVSR